MFLATQNPEPLLSASLAQVRATMHCWTAGRHHWGCASFCLMPACGPVVASATYASLLYPANQQPCASDHQDMIIL